MLGFCQLTTPHPFFRDAAVPPIRSPEMRSKTFPSLATLAAVALAGLALAGLALANLSLPALAGVLSGREFQNLLAGGPEGTTIVFQGGTDKIFYSPTLKNRLR